MLEHQRFVAGEDAEIKQLLWVIENLQEELHISNRAFGNADLLAKERQAVVDRLEVRCQDHLQNSQSLKGSCKCRS